MFKNLSIGKKLAAGFGTLILVLIIVSSLNYSAFQSMSERFSDSKEAAHDKAFIIDKEVDHLKWMAALSELFLDDTLSRLSIQTDDHKCGLGTWLYSEETKRRRAEDPNIDALLVAIEEPHRQLHASAIDINNTYRALDTELESLLADRWIDHLQWVNGLSGSILDGSTFSGELDHKNCAFGKWYYSYTADDPSLQEMLEKWDEPHKLLHQSAREIVARQKSGDGSGAHQVYVQSTLPALTSLEAAFLASTEWVDTAAAYRTRAQAIFETDTRNAVAATQDKLADLRAYFDKLADSASTQADHQRASSVSWLILLSVVGILIGVSAAWFITRAMTRPIRELVRVTEHMNREFTDLERVVRAISENDLTNEIEESEAIRIMVGCRDEIGALCNSVNECVESKSRMANSMRRMAANLRAMIADLSDNSTQLVSAANEISSSSEQMSRGAKDQAGQLEQVSAAVEEMTVTILESSKSTGDASNAAENASGTATSGGTIVAETIQGMQRIASVVKESSESITRLAQSADEIGEIISVIDDIADQTNLLALNAAIEAARAGEQGRGFAVVADEVRKLAERTGKATGEITDMIKSVQEQTQGAVASMESGITEIDSGRELADRAGASLTDIVNMSQQVMDMISQIATAAEEQSSAAEQISRNVEHVSRITQESATGAQQSASAAEQLNRQAEQLQVMVSKFKI